jgi:hypothetical protein
MTPLQVTLAGIGGLVLVLLIFASIDCSRERRRWPKSEKRPLRGMRR